MSKGGEGHVSANEIITHTKVEWVATPHTNYGLNG